MGYGKTCFLEIANFVMKQQSTLILLFPSIKIRRHLIKFNRLSFFLFSFFDCDKKKIRENEEIKKKN